MSILSKEELQLSRYITFSREEWAQRRANTPLTLSEERLASLRSLNDPISLADVEQIYLPLSRLLNLYVATARELYSATSTFLGHSAAQVPYIIGVAGSVAVGKSTTARLLQTLLSAWPNHPRVELVTTDGFLYPNHHLQERGLMQRKGFPESYDLRHLLRFLAEVKAGRSEVDAPIYSHLVYDIVPDQKQRIRQPDILIVEGLNILQVPASANAFQGPGQVLVSANTFQNPGETTNGKKAHPSHNLTPGQRLSVSDFLDFTIYVDAEEQEIERWYTERFLLLRQTAFRDPSSYFSRYAQLTVEEAHQTASKIWGEINAPNLRENILPTRSRAHLILKKGENHLVQEIWLRKL
jgi:type I pantothenate kinase